MSQDTEIAKLRAEIANLKADVAGHHQALDAIIQMVKQVNPAAANLHNFLPAKRS